VASIASQATSQFITDPPSTINVCPVMKSLAVGRPDKKIDAAKNALLTDAHLNAVTPL